jgi:hypothetical protein
MTCSVVYLPSRAKPGIGIVTAVGRTLGYTPLGRELAAVLAQSRTGLQRHHSRPYRFTMVCPKAAFKEIA